MKVCICGGGALGHACAAIFGSRKGVTVNLLTGHPELWGQEVVAKASNGTLYQSHLNAVSDNPAVVIPGQDIILLCLPGFLMEKTMTQIRPFIGDALIGSVVASTGFFFFAHKLLPPGTRLFGFQRSPYIARVESYGKSVALKGFKPSIAMAVENIPDPESFASVLSDLFMTPITLLGSSLEVSVSNSNPILHTGRLYTMFKGREEALFDHNILFYEEWTDEASRVLIAMDQEFFRLLDALNLHGTLTLLEYYESDDVASLTRKLSSIPAFKGIISPMKKVDGGWKADYTSRYFTEDFPFGLRWIKELAEENNIKTPVIDEVYAWGMDRL